MVKYVTFYVGEVYGKVSTIKSQILSIFTKVFEDLCISYLQVLSIESITI